MGLQDIYDASAKEKEKERLRAENERLRDSLKQALRQWSMYAEMIERNDGFDLATEKSPEGEMYRAAKALADSH